MQTPRGNTSNSITRAANLQGHDLAAVFTDLMLSEDYEQVDRLYRAEYTTCTCNTPVCLRRDTCALDNDLGTPIGPRLLAAFVARLQATQNAYHARRFPTLAPPKISIDKSRNGQRFLRIVESGCPEGSRQVYGFIEAATGKLYKAASFKAAETNYPRGDIRDLPTRWALESVSIC